MTTGGRSVHAQSASPTIPFLDGLQGQSTETGVESAFVRQTNGTYVNLQFSTARPFSLVSPLSTVTGLLAEGLKNLAAAPAGPAGVGLQSQTYAIGYLADTGGIALALGGGSVVEVYQVTAALAY